MKLSASHFFFLGKGYLTSTSQKARASDQARSITWRADSICSANETPTWVWVQCTAAESLSDHSAEECLYMGLHPFCWTRCLGLEILPSRFPYALWSLIFLAAVAHSKWQWGYLWAWSPTRSPAVLSWKILDVKMLKTHHLQIQWHIPFLHIALTSEETESL